MGRAVQWLTDRVAATGRPLHPASIVALGRTVSPVLEAALRCSREPQLMPVARLRHRTAVHSTRPPANQDVRARTLPTALWPEWALRLSPRHPDGKPVARRADELLAIACLLADHLDTHGAPIDYTRRRALFTARSRFLDPRAWRELQRGLRSNPGVDAANAQR